MGFFSSDESKKEKYTSKLRYHQRMIDDEPHRFRHHTRKAASYRRLLDNTNARIRAKRKRKERDE